LRPQVSEDRRGEPAVDLPSLGHRWDYRSSIGTYGRSSAPTYSCRGR
jgi:hypothetical protein